MRQSSRVLLPLPACVALAAATLAGYTPLHAQASYRATRGENFRRAPSPAAPVLATVTEGATLPGGRTQDGWIEVTLEGWIWSPSVERTNQDGHDLRVRARVGENLRAGPNRAVIARLSTGTLLDEVRRDGQWIQVRRTGWMWGQSLQRTAVSRSGAGGGGAATADSGARLDWAALRHAAALMRVPGGDTTAELSPDASVRVVARSGEWVRVQTEGWVRETDLRPSAPGVLVGVSGAEVRARPAEYEGKLLQWTVQFIAIQEPDELRSEIPPDQSYILTRGPLPEAGFVYVVLPPDLRAEVERLPPLAELVIIARVRAGRSRFLGNPVVELVDMAVRQQ